MNINNRQSIELIKYGLRQDITDTMTYVNKLQENAELEVCVLGWSQEQIKEIIDYRRVCEIRINYGASNILFAEMLLQDNIKGAADFLKKSQKYNEACLEYIMEKKIREGPLLKIAEMIKADYYINRETFRNFLILNHNLNK